METMGTICQENKRVQFIVQMAATTAWWLTTAPLALLTSIACLVLGIVFFDLTSPLLSFGLFATALVTFVYRLRFFEYGGRARALSGNAPFFGTNAPWDELSEVVNGVVRVMEANKGAPPQIVGCGWGYFIGRRTAKRALFTHHLRGRPDAQKRRLWFYCGTTLAEASEVIHDEFQKTFWSTPTHQNISIGSWLARSCHGNAGASGKPSSYAAEWVDVIHMHSVATAAKGVKRYAYKDAKLWFDEFPEDWFLVAVEFNEAKLAPNLWLKKRLVTVPAQANGVSTGLALWLLEAPVLRVLFFGTARTYGLGITETEVPDTESAPKRRPCGCCPEVPHIDPHDCSAPCMSFQLDTCSLLSIRVFGRVLGGWYEQGKNAYNGITRLKDANAFSPSNLLDALPLIPLVVMGTGLLNFEFIFHLREGVSKSPAEIMQQLCNDLIALFSGRGGIWGRAELRIGSLKRGLVFVDTIARESDAPRVVETLAWFVQNGQIAMHDSKYRSKLISAAMETIGLEETSPRVVFAGKKPLNP